jgi:hypothetical protein
VSTRVCERPSCPAAYMSTPSIAPGGNPRGAEAPLLHRIKAGPPRNVAGHGGARILGRQEGRLSAD